MNRFPAAVLILAFTSSAFAQQTTVFTGGPNIDTILNDAVRTERIPGAVVVVGHNDQVVYQKVYGQRAVTPRREPMAPDTIFDVASLTKVIATTSSIMKLVERGQVRLADRVTVYLPEFQGGNSEITVRQLLTHYSGMRPDLDLQPEWSGYQTGITKALADKPTARPDARFTYSDINFILLGEIVHKVSGKMLPEFARQEIFEPLGMKDTMFTPPDYLRPRIAPTEVVKAGFEPLRGVVHDPTTRYMGGIAGHAGLFSTAQDLARFARMMINGGELEGVRIFSPLTVETFTSPQSPPDRADVRGLGWDIDSRFSGNRGDLFPIGSFGHTGFTGTSIWIDPTSKAFVILLTNSVHPKQRPVITPVRSRVASAAAAGLQIRGSGELSAQVRGAARRRVSAPVSRDRVSAVQNGIDVLAAEKFASLAGKRVGLITNHTGVLRDGTRNIEAMRAAGVDLKALFSPEHGIVGKEDHENIGSTKDAASGLPVYSLYEGQNRRPNDAMLRDIDVLVFDIQDIGARFYTYVCTMKNAMEEAARKNLEFVVLDRPNPITGTHVEGPMIEPGLMSFVGCLEMPLRHGMTIGELATMANAGMQPKARLRVVKMTGWQRGDWFDSTGLQWINPSPNMRSLTAALLYPGIGMFEYGKVYSVGRGTDAPFEQVGADWMDGRRLAEYLNLRNLPGIRVYPTVLKPTSSNFSGQTVEGVKFLITDRDRFDSVRFGVELGAALEKLFPGRMKWSLNEKLAGSRRFLNGFGKPETAETILQGIEAETEAFRVRRQAWLLYQE